MDLDYPQLEVEEVIDPLREKYAKNHFTQFIKGKKVVIVGPNTDLIGKGLGKRIDQYDIVIRHNTVLEYLPFTRELQKDFGRRTDVLYLSPQCIKDYSFKDRFLQKIKESRIKFVVYMNGNKDNKYITGDYCFPKNLEYFKKALNRLRIPFHYSHHTARGLTELMCHRAMNREVIPRVGFISIFDQIVHEAKSVKIMGMSFYHGGGHAFRKEVKKELDPKKNALGKISCHDSHVELNLLKELLEKYPQISWTELHQFLKPAESEELAE